MPRGYHGEWSPREVPWVLNVLPRKNIEGALWDFLRTNSWPHPRPDQRPKTLGACGPSGLWSFFLTGPRQVKKRVHCFIAVWVRCPGMPKQGNSSIPDWASRSLESALIGCTQGNNSIPDWTSKSPGSAVIGPKQGNNSILDWTSKSPGSGGAAEA